MVEQQERLADHAFKTEVWDKALTYLRRAGAKALARSAFRESLAFYEQALAALRHLPESSETLEQAVDLRLDLRSSLLALGEIKRSAGFLLEAQALARTLGDQQRLGWVSAYLSHHFWQIGQWSEALTFGQTARAIATTFGDFPLRVVTNCYLGQACLAGAAYRQAEGFLVENVESLQGEAGHEPLGLAWLPLEGPVAVGPVSRFMTGVGRLYSVRFAGALSRSYLASVLAEQGRFAEAIAHGAEGLRLAEAVDHGFSLIVACWLYADVYALKGKFGQATRLLERALALCRERTLPLLSLRVTGSLGSMYAGSGRVMEGLALLEQTLGAIESVGEQFFRSRILVRLGEALLFADRLADARPFAAQALALARERGERGHEAWALRLLGMIASHPDPSDAELTEGHYREAMALAEELGMRPLVAHCHLGLGKLYRRTGQRPEALEHLTTATTMYREMDMGFWLEQAETELREWPDVPYCRTEAGGDG